MNKSFSIFINIVTAGILVLAIGRWFYSYYMILRVVVFVAGFYSLHLSISERSSSRCGLRFL
jgi:hypothetical protein